MRLCWTLLFICMMRSTVCGLRCYTCWSVNPGNCNQIRDCPAHYDRCATSIVADNLITKECMRSDMCNVVSSVGIRCCSEDTCNGAKPVGIHLPLLLTLPAVITLFI